MDYVIEKIIRSLYKWTVEGRIVWEIASKYRYKEVTGIDKPQSEFRILICEQKIDDESYFIVLEPYINPDNDEEILVSINIIKDKEFLYSKGVSEEEVEGLWCEARYSQEHLGKFLRHLEPLDTTENVLLEESKDYLTKIIERTTHSQSVNELLERQAQQINFLMHKVGLLEEEIFILKQSRETVR